MDMMNNMNPAENTNEAPQGDAQTLALQQVTEALQEATKELKEIKTECATLRGMSEMNEEKLRKVTAMYEREKDMQASLEAIESSARFFQILFLVGIGVFVFVQFILPWFWGG